MKRCKECILPENYPRITFNEEGICNYCITYKEREYLGGDALKEKINSFLKNKKDRNKNYDCVLGLSGGRDSSYLLYYLVKILNLKVLAYSADNGFIPEQIKLNMKNMTDMLNVKLVIEKHDLLKKCLKHTISSWVHRPSLAMVELLCTGCRLGIIRGTLNFAKKNKIPVIIGGATPFERQDYRGVNGGNFSAILGYLSHIIINPKWVMNYTYLITQIKEYYYYFRSQKLIKKSDILKISPFWTHIKWKEKEVISTIKNELNWEKNPNIESTWRGDCDIALLKLYFYKKTLGFNDKVDGLSNLIRDNQITRGEALKRLKKEEEIPEEVINEIFHKLGLNYLDLKNVLRKMQENKYEKKTC
jgi:hypothetical protein